MIHRRLLIALPTLLLVSIFLFLYTPRQLHTLHGSSNSTEEFVFRPQVKIAFITSYFKPDNAERSSEIDICLASLVANPFVSQVHVLVEAKDQPLPSFAVKHPKTKEALVHSRPVMGDFIQYSCDHLMDHRVLFANSDIFYDSTLEYFMKISDQIFDSTFYAISRWWYDDGGHTMFGDDLSPDRPKGMTPHPYPRYGSYDTFAFQPRAICKDKSKLEIIVASLNYTLGVLGAENRLLYEIKRQYPEMRLENPFKAVKSIHMHSVLSRSAGWENRVNLDGKTVEILDY
ncbi:putative ATP-dependent RNA helicase ddx49 [Mortierella antarctica]|nr:putative ATP-dependent RNA helicase ddx49 [Mortierella antarctica]